MSVGNFILVVNLLSPAEDDEGRVNRSHGSSKRVCSTALAQYV